MSEFKNYHSYLIDLGSTVASWKEEFRDILTAEDWVIVKESDNDLLVRPPESETIGNEVAHQLLQVQFSEDRVRFIPRLWYKESTPVTFAYRNSYTSTSSAHSGGNMTLTLLGDDVVYTNAHLTQNERTEALYNLCITAQTTYPETWGKVGIELDKTDKRGDGFWWIYIVIDEEDLGLDWFSFGNEYPVSHSFGSGGQISGFYSKAPRQPVAYRPVTETEVNNLGSVQINLASGFIYYLSVFDRALCLATKTTTDFYGPISAVWAPSDIILQQTPPGLAPIELFVLSAENANIGGTSVANNNNAKGYTTHLHGYYIRSNTTTPFIPDISYTGWSGSFSSAPFQVVNLREGVGRLSPTDDGKLLDLSIHNTGAMPLVSAKAGGINARSYELISHVYPIVNVEIEKSDRSGYNSTANGYGYAAETTTAFLEEVFLYLGSATDESLHLARIVDLVTEVTAGATAIDTTIEVADTSLFPTDGTLIINNEVIEYSGKTSTSFTGLTRARYGTQPNEPEEVEEEEELSDIVITPGDTVYGTRWFVKINDGAIMAGTKKPEAVT